MNKTNKIIVMILIMFGLGGEVWADMVDDLVPIIIQAESSGRPNVVGEDGEVGLCQISPILLKEWNDTIDKRFFPRKVELRVPYQVKHLFEPFINITIAEWHLNRLKDQLKKHNLLDKAHLIMAYNSGLSEALKNPIPKRHKNKIYNKIYKEYWKGKN